MPPLRFLQRLATPKWVFSSQRTPGAISQTLLAPPETISKKLPRNIHNPSDLPADKMQFGFSFQDVPGLRLSACRLLQFKDCTIEMLLDDWDSVFVDVKMRRNKPIRLRGLGLPSTLPNPARPSARRTWQRAAMPLEVWSGNYGHWLAYHLPKLMAFIENGWHDDIVLPERGRWKEVEARDLEFLELLEPTISRHLRLQEGVTQVTHLGIIDGDPHHQALLRRVAKRLKQNSCASTSTAKSRFLISRKNAGYRKLLNEEELSNSLQKYAFEPIVLEDLPLRQQIELFSSAECVIGIHGSGLANMIFCSQDTKVIELVSGDFPCPDFYRLANTLELPYYIAFGEAVGDSRVGYKDMLAPVDAVASLVREVVSRIR